MRTQILRTLAGVLLAVGLALLSAGCATIAVPGESTRSTAKAAEARRNIGIDHVVSGRIAFGIRDLRHALELEDQDAMTHLWLGQAYHLRGRMDDALTHAERAVELDPGKHEARLNLSVIYIQRGRWGDAIAQADWLIDDPTFSSPWRALNNRAWAQIKQNQLTVARQSLEEALEFRPRYWPALLNLGILEGVEGDHLGSLRFLQEVIEFGPGSGTEAEAHYRMAEAYVRLGHRERAQYHLKTAIEVSPNGRWGRQSRDYLALLH